mmetsp:Transcript_76089/g.105181  ORF Transcript_76089/g.105181 Transcript_76089/m.105181 type:complete len:92 (-) Transcript_76089:34-309(-)
MADNGFDDDDDVLEAMRNCFLKNKTLGRYDIRYNNFSEDGIKEITEMLGEAPNVFDVEVSERMDEEVMKDFLAALSNNKPKKGKKGKKKKK